MGRRHRHRDSGRKLEGNLCDIPISGLIALCQERALTGTVSIDSWGRTGRLQFRAGTLEAVMFGDLRGDDALASLAELRDGRFQLLQHLPSVDRRDAPAFLPSGASGRPDELVFDLAHTSLPAIMEQCQNQALSCAISVDRQGSPIELTYRAGELARIEGASDATLVDLHALGPAAARIQALPLREPKPRPTPTPTPSEVRADAPRRRRRSSPPPLPAQLQAPGPLRHAQQSTMPPADLSPGRLASSPVYYATQGQRQAPGKPPAPGQVPHGRGWVDPTWVNNSRNIDWTWTQPTMNTGLAPRLPRSNTMLGVGLLCLTLLVGVMASL